MAQLVKNLPAMQEAWGQSLGQEDPLEKGNGSPLHILAWKMPGMRSLAGYSPRGHKELGTTEQLTLSLFTFISAKQLRNCASNTVI